MDRLHQSHSFDQGILRRRYGYFKSRSAIDFVETRVKLMTLEPEAISSTPIHEQGDSDPISAPNDVSTERYLDEHLALLLGQRNSDIL
jgi:hypothetical protein